MVLADDILEHGSSVGRMPDSQLREHGFESPLLPFRSVVFSFSPRRTSSLSCVNEYLVIDGGGNVSELVFARNCCVARMLPREFELVSE